MGWLAQVARTLAGWWWRELQKEHGEDESEARAHAATIKLHR